MRIRLTRARWRWAIAIIAIGTLLAVCAAGFLLYPIACLGEYQRLQRWLAHTESYTVMVYGVRMHYDVQGPKNGAPVVLVHGLGGSSDDWSNMAPALARAGYRVYMPDLPGFGRSERPVQFSYSMRDQATVLVAYLDAIGLKRVDLGGWSMGGWIAQLVAARHPERIRKLVLLDSAGLRFYPSWNTRLFTPTNAQELDQLDALLMSHPPLIPGYIARDVLRTSAQQSWIIRRSMGSMMSGMDVTDRLLPSLKMPVLLVWGTEDRITPLALGETMHRSIRESELEVFAGCDHMAPRLCAGQIAPKVVDFIKR